MSKNLILHSDSLLSKWGFSDGDIISDYVYDNAGIDDFSYNPHKVLEELVKRYLLPKLDKKVEIMFIDTNHNPVRAEMIDGEYYENHYNHDDDGLLGNIKVALSPEIVMEVVKKFTPKGERDE